MTVMQQLSHRTKLILTATFCFTNFIYGLAFSTFGPTLPDTLLLIDATTDQATYGIAARQFFYGCSAGILGILFKKLDRGIALIVSLVGCAIAIEIMPLCVDFKGFLGANMLFAVASGCTELAVNVWVLEIWKQDANRYMQALHFNYAFGSIFGPLIARPFLAPDAEPLLSINSTSNWTSSEHNDYSDIFNLLEPSTNKSKSLSTKETHIVVPYSIASGLFLLIALVHLITRYAIPYKQESKLVTSNDEKISNDNNNDVNYVIGDNNITAKQLEAQGIQDASKTIDTSDQLDLSQMPLKYSLILIPGTAILLGLQGGTEQTVFSFLETFAITIPLKFTKARGAILNSVLFGFFTLSRFISIFIAMKVKPKFMILMDLIVVAIGAVMVQIFATTSWEPGLWMGVAIMGFGYSSCWPAIFAFVEQRIRITDFIGGVFFLGTATNSTVMALIVGNFIEQDPTVLSRLSCVAAAGCLVMFSILCYTDRIRLDWIIQKRIEEAEKKVLPQFPRTASG